MLTTFSMKWLRPKLEALLKCVAGLTYYYPRCIAFLLLILAICMTMLASFRLGVVNSANDLIDPHSEVLGYFLDYLREFETDDPLLVVVESPSFEKNIAVVEELGQRLKKRSDEFRQIYYKNDFRRLKPHLLLFRDKVELGNILETLRSQKELLKATPKGVNLNVLLDQGIQMFDTLEKERGGGKSLEALGGFADQMIGQMEAMDRDLSAPLPKVEDDDKIKASAGPQEEVEKQLALHTYLTSDVASSEATDVSSDVGKMLLIELVPKQGDKNSFSPLEKTISGIRTDMSEVHDKFPDVKISLTGEPVLLQDELNLSTSDMMGASIITFVLITGLFFVAYREMVRPLLVLVTIIATIACTYGFAVLVVGHLNIISQAFVLMLLGLGVDLGIQVLGRYEEELAKSGDVLTALENALQYTGVPVITGGGTAALAFYTMCFNDFRGLVELGKIAGTGMILAIFFNLVMLPALLAWRDKKRMAVVPAHQIQHQEFGNKLDTTLVRMPLITLLIVIVITVWLGSQISQVHFDYNLLNLQSGELESVKMAKTLADPKNFNFLFGVIVADDLKDARVKIAKLKELPEVQTVICPPADLIPADMDERLKVLGDIKKEVDTLNINIDVKAQVDIEKARINLQKLLDGSKKGRDEASKFLQINDPRPKLAFKIFDRLIPSLEKSLNRIKNMSQDEAGRRLRRFQIRILLDLRQQFQFLKELDLEHPITLKDLPAEIAHSYISKNGKVLIEVNSSGNVWERDVNEKFVKGLRSISPRATGTPVQNYVYIDLLRKSYTEAAIYALMGILVALFLHFFHLGRVILAISPLLLGMVWTLGTMVVCHIPFNPANIVTLPLVVGIGVAYGIYIVDRYKQEGKVSVFSSSTGKAVLLSALASIFAFGAMIPGRYPGLVSLGLLMSIGIGYCFIAGTFVLPQVLVLLDRRKGGDFKS